jgi:hypothetical protein
VNITPIFFAVIKKNQSIGLKNQSEFLSGSLISFPERISKGIE